MSGGLRGDGSVRPEKATSWRLATNPDLDLEQLWTEARAAWGQYGYITTWGTAMIAIHALSNLFATDQPDVLRPVARLGVPEEVYAPAPNRRRAELAAQETWAWIADVVRQANAGTAVGDSERILKALSRDYKGLDVYFFSWWTRACLLTVEREHPDSLPAYRTALREAWDEY